VYLAGLALLAVGGLLGFWGASLGLLVVARVVIGLGTSAAYPAAIAMVRRQARHLGRPAPGYMFGALAATAQGTLAVGPPLGSLLMALGGWRWTFLVNVPLAVVGAVTALRWLPSDTGAGTDEASPGVLTLARNGPLVVTYLRHATTFLVLYAVLFGWTQWLEQSAGRSVAATGLLLTPMFLASLVVTALAARRRRVRVPLIAGTAVLTVGAAGLLLLDAGTPTWALVVVSVVFGVQNGLNGAGNQAAMYAHAPPRQIGTASGLFRTAQYVGAIVSAGLIGVCFGARATDGGLHRLAAILTAAAALLFVLTATRLRRDPPLEADVRAEALA
jgi:MFS family permease